MAIACDVTDEASCRAAIDVAAADLGGIDAAAIGPLVMLKNADAATWRRTFGTDVIGASLITAATTLDSLLRAGASLQVPSITVIPRPTPQQL